MGGSSDLYAVTIRGIAKWFKSRCVGKQCFFVDTFPWHVANGSLCAKEILYEKLRLEHLQVLDSIDVPRLRLHDIYDGLNEAHFGLTPKKTDCLHWCVSKYIFEPVYHQLYKMLYSKI